MNDEIMKTALRLPRSLHAQIAQSAKARGVSMNAEIIDRLIGTFDQKPDEIKKLTNKLAVAELENLLNEATLSASMLSLMANLKPDSPEAEMEIRDLRKVMTQRIKALGDIQQRMQSITAKIVAD